MMGSAWRKGRMRAAVPLARVHDLKHTSGHRLGAADVPFEDRQDLLGHRSGRITTHYSAPDVSRLIEAAERVCKPTLQTVVRVEGHANLAREESRPKAAFPKLSVM